MQMYLAIAFESDESQTLVVICNTKNNKARLSVPLPFYFDICT